MAKGQWQERRQRPRERWQWLQQNGGKAGLIAALCPMGSNKNLYAIDEEGNDITDEVHDNDKDLQSWCLLEESEHER